MWCWARARRACRRPCASPRQGFGSELQVMALDLAGVMVSAGAACSSGKVKASRVVEAMGRPDLRRCRHPRQRRLGDDRGRLGALRRGLDRSFARHQARRRASAAA